MLRGFLANEFSPGLPKAGIDQVIEGSMKMPRGAAESGRRRLDPSRAVRAGFRPTYLRMRPFSAVV